MRCSKCGSDNREGRKFCTNCGTPLAAACAKCGAAIQQDERFCGECGAPLPAVVSAGRRAAEVSAVIDEGAPAWVPADDLPQGERKTITALFADLKGSTELMRELDPEEARAIIDPVLQLMMDAVHRYDGYVAQSTGDGIFAMFGAPVAHEDHPQRALHAALMIQQELQHYRERLAEREHHRLKPVALEARIGINTGEVVLRSVHTGGHTEYTPVGHAANLAARMQAAAPAGGIIISEETQHLVEGYFELRGLGPTEVKGIQEPLNIYEVIGAGPLHGHFELALRRGLTKFVGRERELHQMKQVAPLP
jgi:class 3 adenylate cyclase